MGIFALVAALFTASAPEPRLAYYADADGDGYGDPGTVRYATGPTPGYTRRVGDCDDTAVRVHPGAVEACNGRDDDCDGVDDFHDTVVGGPTWYADTDSDGFGDPRVHMRSCRPPPGYIDNALDCNDRDNETNPLASELCGGDDNNCDGNVDECDVSLDDAALVVELAADGTPVYGVLAVADLDADGTGDLAIANSRYDATNAPTVYLLPGPLSGRVVLDDAVAIAGTSTVGRGGVSIEAGDADGDGFNDLLVGGDAGVSPAVTYVFLGPVTADRDASDADAVLTNVSTEYVPLDILVMSDHDGDGAADIVVGSGDDGDSYDGAVYVVPGTSTGTVALDSDATYAYLGDGVDFVGYAVADLGDVSGDGISDLAIGAPWGNFGIFIVDGGSVPGSYLAADVASATVTGDSQMGRSLQAVDYDGDGSMDLIAQDDPTDRPEVAALLGPFIGSMDVTDATATWQWASADSASGLGRSFAAADFDGDGETDLIIGASGNYNGLNSGAVFFQWGIASGLVDVGSLPYVAGSFGTASLGLAVAALPDWNGDGIPEVAIEAEYRPDFSMGILRGFFSGSY
jgi:hypothetical protein